MKDRTRETLLDLLSELEPKECLVTSSKLKSKLVDLGAQCNLGLLALENYEPESFSKTLSEYLCTDLVILSDTIESFSRERCTEIVGSIRNQLNAKVIFIATSQCPLTFNDLIGLGFRKSEHQGADEQIFTYDIASYNKKREWNNSRFWANPENFDKFRW